MVIGLVPKLNYVNCAAASPGKPFHRMAYWEWNATGDPLCPHVVVCAHGLSRQGRDFDVLASHLSERVRVICPDVVGRGQSDWLLNPIAYQLPLYVLDMLALLAQVQRSSRIDTLDWIGTSMGGLVGMMLASAPRLLRPPIRRLLLNDVGPVTQWNAIERIRTYMAKPSRFDSVEEAAQTLRAYAPGFGPHTDVQWLELSRHMLRRLPDGAYTLHYDPAIATSLSLLTPETLQASALSMWQVYDQVACDVLLLRGSESDLLMPGTAHEMTLRGPRARLFEVAGVGHAPTFVAKDQQALVDAFIFSP